MSISRSRLIAEELIFKEHSSQKSEDNLAMAESERYLPLLIDKVEKICEENGLRNDSIVMRMTGCPNGCARPYLAGMYRPDLVSRPMADTRYRGRFRW